MLFNSVRLITISVLFLNFDVKVKDTKIKVNDAVHPGSLDCADALKRLVCRFPSAQAHCWLIVRGEASGFGCASPHGV